MAYSLPCSNDSEHVQSVLAFITRAALHNKLPCKNEGQAFELNDMKWEKKMRIIIRNFRGLEFCHQKFH